MFSLFKKKLITRFIHCIFSTILNRRAELIDENKALANQNIELRMLLAQYMQSNVNQELQIPPTKILQNN